MGHIGARADDAVLAEVDRLVAEGAFGSRSEAVRVALRRLVDERRRAHAGDSIAAEYRRRPQTPAEVGWPDVATAAMVAAEPW